MNVADIIQQKNTVDLAKTLLGKYLVQDGENGEMASMITEVEAYDGFDDKASHASRGKTKRNAVMFAEGGVWYVYLCYGVHWMLNLVTGPKDYPAAILIRGTADVEGPGRLTKYFDINKRFNGKCALGTPSNSPSYRGGGPDEADSTDNVGGLRIEDRDANIDTARITATPRIGVDYAGEWADKPYRFVLANA